MNKDHNREKDISEDHVVKLKEDIRKLRGDVNQMECQQHEATMVKTAVIFCNPPPPPLCMPKVPKVYQNMSEIAIKRSEFHL